MIDKAQLDARLLSIGLTRTQITGLSPATRIEAWAALVQELNAEAQAAEMVRIADINTQIAANNGRMATAMEKP